MKPIYTTENTSPAFQLNWSVSLFGKVDFPERAAWLAALKSVTEPDGVRILEYRTTQPNVGQFLISTLPGLSPSQIVRSVKGRWQYLIRADHPSAFRRNYSIASVGEANCQTLDRYVAGQARKHTMADARVQERLQTLQFHDATVDLGKPIVGNFGPFTYGLQVVVENKGGWNETRKDVLAESRAMIVRAAAKKGWRLSRIGILCNHIHVLLGAATTESPASVALSLLNNLASVQDMKPVFRFSYYVGTFGSYNRHAVRRQV